MGLPKRLNIYRWHRPGSRYGNFGDEITIPLLRELFGIEAIPSRMEEAELLGSGSILDAWALTGRRGMLARLFRRKTARRLHIWGSGFILPDTKAAWPQEVHFHAVRGELTARRTDSRAVLGDPGILASMLLKKRPAAAAEVGVVPHYGDFGLFDTAFRLPPHWRLIDPCGPVEQVVRDIASCEIIVSSSLHGLITADSFGIPCVWLSTEKPSANPPPYKFDDYATARRAAFNDPLTYAEVLAMRAEAIMRLAYPPGRPLEPWQTQLIEAFPEDL